MICQEVAIPAQRFRLRVKTGHLVLPELHGVVSGGCLGCVYRLVSRFNLWSGTAVTLAKGSAAPPVGTGGCAARAAALWLNDWIVRGRKARFVLSTTPQPVERSARTTLALVLSVISMFIALGSLAVSFLGYSPSVYAFFGAVTPSHQAARDENVELFIQAVSSRSPKQIDSALDTTEAGSFARMYLTYSYWTNFAYQKQHPGSTLGAWDVIPDGDGWLICEPGATNNCSRWSDFVFTSDDQIREVLRDGQRLAGILVIPEESVTKESVMIVPLSGRTLPGESVYVLRLRNMRTEPVQVNGCALMNTDLAQVLTQRDTSGWPSILSPWQEAVYNCEFATGFASPPQYVGLKVQYGESAMTIWTTFQR